MYVQIFTEREQQMLKVVDTINELCVQQTDVLIAVPKFVAKLQTLQHPDHDTLVWPKISA